MSRVQYHSAPIERNCHACSTTNDQDHEDSEVKQQLNQLVNQVYREETRILVEKSGIPEAGLVSVEDLRRLDRLDREWEEGTRAIERFSRAFADVPTEVAEAEVARIIAELRRQRAAEGERKSA